jgi:Transposase IS4
MKEYNRGLIWNSMLTEVVDSTVVFLWQDNNAVLGLITAHCLKNDTVERLRRRPSLTSTNARIVRPVFGDLPFKRLQIPRAIDDYNHYMNGVDRSNQLRKNFTVRRPYEHRVWRPLWYYILDVCAVNGYLIWKGDSTDIAKRGQRPFRNTLINALLNILYPQIIVPLRPYRSKPISPPNQNGQDHHWRQFEKRGYCVWCRKNAQESEKSNRRPALVEIVNGASSNASQRTKRSCGGCGECMMSLCKEGPCFKQYHSQ